MAQKKKTAAELLEELNNDASYKKTIARKEEENRITQKVLLKDEELISSRLREVGISIDSIYDLVNSEASYAIAIPILIDLIENERLKHSQIIEGVVRALAVKEAIGIANKSLIRLYLSSSEKSDFYRWAIGNTMEVIITDEDLEEVLPIVSNSENGISRQMFISALGKIKSEKAEEILINLLDDEQVRLHTIEALGKMKSKKAKSKIELYSKNSKGVIKKAALKALKKICK